MMHHVLKWYVPYLQPVVVEIAPISEQVTTTAGPLQPYKAYRVYPPYKLRLSCTTVSSPFCSLLRSLLRRVQRPKAPAVLAESNCWIPQSPRGPEEDERTTTRRRRIMLSIPTPTLHRHPLPPTVPLRPISRINEPHWQPSLFHVRSAEASPHLPQGPDTSVVLALANR